MTKLIRADLARMLKTKSFWICGVLSTVITVGSFISTCSVRKYVMESFGTCLFADCMNISLFAAIFAGLFLGTDYSNGTIRNKMAVGHGRCSVYFSNLIITSAVGAAYQIIAWAGIAAAGLIIHARLGIGSLGMGSGELALRLVTALLTIIAMCSLFTLAGMLIASKSTIVVITIVGTIMLLLSGVLLVETLAAPEMISGGYSISIDGGVVELPLEPNPMYIRGVWRDILSVVRDVLPSGQMTQLQMSAVDGLALMPLWSVLLTSAVSVIGAVVFRRKDLK